AGPYLDGTFTVGPSLEESYCYFRYPDPTTGSCLLGIDTDIGADTITLHGYNLLPPPNSYDSTANYVSFAFAGVEISAASIVSNTFPGPDFVLSLADNVVSWTHGAWVWEANSQYTIVLGVTTVPEPGTLSMLGVGLLGLVLLRRKAA